MAATVTEPLVALPGWAAALAGVSCDAGVALLEVSVSAGVGSRSTPGTAMAAASLQEGSSDLVNLHDEPAKPLERLAMKALSKPLWPQCLLERLLAKERPSPYAGEPRICTSSPCHICAVIASRLENSQRQQPHLTTTGCGTMGLADGRNPAGVATLMAMLRSGAAASARSEGPRGSG